MALRPQHVAPELLNKVTKTLGITALDQWYYVSQKAAAQAIGARALNTFGSTSGFLKSAYPHHHFDEEKLGAGKNQERDQKFIEIVIRKLFPNTEIQTKARKAVGIINPETDAYLEIDFWLPSLKLGIEYQDRHHYEYQWYANGALEDYQKRDNVKKAAMPTLGYTLITIGYWWNKTLESVAATIRKVRPDLLEEYDNTSAEPIASEPPLGYMATPVVIPGVAGLMSPFIPSFNFNPTNWYAGEKHDGIRGVYNPTLNKMFSRSGNELSVLPSLLKDIPDMLVEGEIIAGRGNYSKTTAMSFHSHHDKVNWPLFRFIIFDVPDAEMGNYVQRYSSITHGLSSRPFIFAQPAFRVLLNNKNHLKMLVDATISDAGEGMIVQKDAQYEYGRAKSVAKIKVRRDADAQVRSVSKVSCTCKLLSGVSAEITFSADFDPSNLQVGDIISYYHNGYTQSGIPIQGEIYKVRYDVSWDKLKSENAHNSVKRRSVSEATGGSSLLGNNSTARNKMGHWNKSINVRSFFDEFARNSGFDPLVPDNWYPITTKTLQNSGGSSLLHAHGFSFKKALLHAYPEVNFEMAKFRTIKAKRNWSKPQNVRAFFDDFARRALFDPLVPKNWYEVKRSVLKNAGAHGILKVFSYKKALQCAYPELKWEENFRTRKPKAKKHWGESENVRVFFDKFAKKAGFDPLVPDNWYSVRISALQKAKGSSLLHAYGFKFKNALLRAYPELKFDMENFRTRKARKHWNESPNVRAFFNEFAQASGFDPLVVENWYPVVTKTLERAGGAGLLKAYGYKKALLHAYPELKFDLEKLRIRDGHA